MVRAYLTHAGHNVSVVGDGATAIEALSAVPIDLAIVDLSMPHIDGFRLISMIRHTPALMKLPILVVSSRTDQASIDEVSRLGANRHLVKPIDWTTFASHVAATLKAVADGGPAPTKVPETEQRR
jgi:DNA-binding response OmpR family regulator